MDLFLSQFWIWSHFSFPLRTGKSPIVLQATVLSVLTGSVCCTLLPGDTAQRDPILTLPMTHRRRGSPPLRDSATVTHPCVTGLSSSQLYLETMTPHLFIAMSRLCTATEKMAFCVITRWHCLPGNSHVSLHSHLPCSSPLHSYITVSTGLQTGHFLKFYVLIWS